MLTDHDVATILIIDDSTTNLEVLSSTLSEAGYKVKTQLDGRTGIEQARKELPSLILLDLMMPQMDGFETCRKLQADPETQSIPVIFMTASSDPEDKIQGFRVGAVDYIVKPFQREEVFARIEVHLKLRRLQEALTQQNQELEQRVQERTSELTATLSELKNAQLQLVQSEKMSSVGQLIAGIAHEINNPIGFIKGNLNFASTSILDVIDCLKLYQEKLPEPGEEIEEKIEEINLEYLLHDIPKMLESMKVGTQRILGISQSLRTFSRADVDVAVLADLHEGLDSTLMLLQHRLKASSDRVEITVIKDYGDVPAIKCYLGQLNQVFMNILSNAIDALEEHLVPHPTIRIETAVGIHAIAIRIADNGIGIPEANKAKLFDPFFTTKPVGKGTGLGLSISHRIITEKHQGTLECHSAPGQGTSFVMQLPLI
jgi:two-component system, NtrC family, sensor kinase